MIHIGVCLKDFAISSGPFLLSHFTSQPAMFSLARQSVRAARVPYQILASRALSDSTSGMPLTFSSPYEVFYNATNVKQVDVPSFSGSFGILPKHVPLLAVLKPGVVTVYENEGATKKYFVSSGTVTINEDASVQVLAEEAVSVDSLDAQAAREALSKAQQQLASASDEVAKAEAQIAVEVSEAIVAASN